MLTLIKATKWIILTTITALVIIACSPSNPTTQQTTTALSNSTDCRMIEHHGGNTEICGKPEKIVVLGPYPLNLLLSIDHQPVAYADPIRLNSKDIFDQPAQQIPYLGTYITTQPINLGTSSNPSLEKLTQLKPDIIFGQIGNKVDYDLLTQIAPTIIVENRPGNRQWAQTIRQMAKALGNEERAEKVISTNQQLIDSARQDLASVVEKHPKILILGTNNLQDRIILINSHTYLGQLMEEIGFKIVSLASTEANLSTVPISIEALPKLNEADIIMVLGFNLKISEEDVKQASDTKTLESLLERNQLKETKKSWQQNQIAQSLTASQYERVYFTSYYAWHGLAGPYGTKLVLQQLRDFLLTDS